MSDFPKPPPSFDKSPVLLLQGGGALGSYQAGLFEALAASAYVPDWVVGVSIGAINAAIIAGNAPGDRVGRLRSFWEEVTAPSAWWPAGLGAALAYWQQQSSAVASLAFGQPGFFAPRPPAEWLAPDPPTSYYDTTPLHRTLEELVDFERINAGTMRLSVGAVEVASGRLRVFDSRETAIGPLHIMASSAMPPGFPPIEIDGVAYWDGGLAATTPLAQVLGDRPSRNRLIFQIDLFEAEGELPAALDDVAEREKDIRAAGRTRAETAALRERLELRHAIEALRRQMPADLAGRAAVKRLLGLGRAGEVDIVNLVYRPTAAQGAAKDYAFGRAAMEAQWQAGLVDGARALRASPWLTAKAAELGVRVFDIGAAP